MPVIVPGLSAGENLQRAITSAGDAAVMLPAAAALAAIVARNDRATALRWAVGVAVALGVTLAGKLLYYLGLAGPCNPSGHTALAMSVLGGVALFAPLLAGARWVGPLRVGCLLAVGAIAYSRVSLGAHTPVEVLAGAATGGLAVMVMAPWRRPLPICTRSPAPVLLAAAAVIALAYGNALTVEAPLSVLAGDILDAVSGHVTAASP